MSKYQSPGQKRRKLVRILSIAIFLITTYLGSIILGKMSSSELDWVKSHKTADAQVNSLVHEEEEYRNRKGRLRTRDVYLLEYTFEDNGKSIINQIKLPKSEFNQLEKGEYIEVWFSELDSSINDTANNVQHKLDNNNTTSNIIGAAPFTAPGSLILYFILAFLFVRESKKSLPEGFYTENSWLDIDDKYMVAIDGTDLVYFSIDDKRTSDAQKAYQEEESLETIMAVSKTSKFHRIPLSEITNLSSNHNSDVFKVTHNDKNHSIEFLNQTVKAHALERIEKLIPKNLKHEVVEKTRLQAAMPAAITLLLLILVGFFADMYLLNLGLGFVAIFWVAPRLISRLLDPTVSRVWSTPEVNA